MRDGKRLAKASPNVSSGERETGGAQAVDYGAPIPLDMEAMDEAARVQGEAVKVKSQTRRNEKRREKKVKAKA